MAVTGKVQLVLLEPTRIGKRVLSCGMPPPMPTAIDDMWSDPLREYVFELVFFG